jgi:hypothetical protein
MPEYTFEITPEGIKMDAKGFRGGECLKELAEIQTMLAALGVETAITGQDLKREAMLASGGTQTQKNREVRE